MYRWLAFFLAVAAVSCGTLFSREPVKLVLIGDSTLAEKRLDRRPETGWGEALSPFFNDTVEVVNLAVNGRSTKSFIDEGRWDEALALLGEGDFLVVEFGHNDQKSHDPSRYAAPREGYADNLRKFVQEAQGKGADVLLLSSICRRTFSESGALHDTHGEYPAAVAAVCEELAVPYVDMERRTRRLLEAMGRHDSKSLFLHLDPGESENYPEGKVDDTHLNRKGAVAVAELFVTALRESRHPLAARLK